MRLYASQVYLPSLIAAEADSSSAPQYKPEMTSLDSFSPATRCRTWREGVGEKERKGGREEEKEEEKGRERERERESAKEKTGRERGHEKLREKERG